MDWDTRRLVHYPLTVGLIRTQIGWLAYSDCWMDLDKGWLAYFPLTVGRRKAGLLDGLETGWLAYCSLVVGWIR